MLLLYLDKNNKLLREFPYTTNMEIKIKKYVKLQPLVYQSSKIQCFTIQIRENTKFSIKKKQTVFGSVSYFPLKRKSCESLFGKELGFYIIYIILLGLIKYILFMGLLL